MFKKSKINPKLLTQEKVQQFFANGNIWHGKKELLASDLDIFNEIDIAAFQDQRGLVKIEIPSSITKIGNGAFIDCLRLKEVILHDGIKSFGLAMFAGCFSLKKVNIPNNFLFIPTATFADCSLLENIELPDSIKKIGSRAFANCLSLKKIFIPKSVEVINEDAFVNCPSLEKGLFSSVFYYQAHHFGMFEEQFNTLNANLKSKVSNEFLKEQRLLTNDEYTRIAEKIEIVKFKPREVQIITPRALLKDDNKVEENAIVTTSVKKGEDERRIPVDQKHTIVPLEEYLNNYNYDERRNNWHKLAGHNERQLVCWGCKDDDNWETILLDNGEHVCYYCWIKKPAVKKSNALVVKKSKPAAKKPAPKAETKKSNALVVKKAQPAKPKKINGIEVGKKHVVVKSSEIEKYNYDKRRKQWHANAGYNEKALKCSVCKDDKHTSVLTDENKHICYNCFIKKPSKNQLMVKPKSK